MNATILNFMVDGNLVAKSITGKVIDSRMIHGIDCVVVNLGKWGNFTYPNNSVVIG